VLLSWPGEARRGKNDSHWVRFTAEDEDVKGSVVLVECYGYEKVREVSVEETAYPHRNWNIHLVASMKYSDPSLDQAAERYGDKFREILHGEQKSV
jgi:hypothetical protein